MARNPKPNDKRSPAKKPKRPPQPQPEPEGGGPKPPRVRDDVLEIPAFLRRYDD